MYLHDSLISLSLFYQLMHENSGKQNETLNTLLEKKKNEYDQQIIRNEELAGINQEQTLELKAKVHQLAVTS